MWLGQWKVQEETLSPQQREDCERNLIVSPHRVLVALGLVFAENILGFCFHSLQPTILMFTAFRILYSPTLCSLLNGWPCLLLKNKTKPRLNCPTSCPQFVHVVLSAPAWNFLCQGKAWSLHLQSSHSTWLPRNLLSIILSLSLFSPPNIWTCSHPGNSALPAPHGSVSATLTLFSLPRENLERRIHP